MSDDEDNRTYYVRYENISHTLTVGSVVVFQNIDDREVSDKIITFHQGSRMLLRLLITALWLLIRSIDEGSEIVARLRYKTSTFSL
ncbi:17987_t:CDS:2 [Funneliformis geosporum]|nr:17987_t:CDS:2 [Funneliformis geosporum]